MQFSRNLANQQQPVLNLNNQNQAQLLYPQNFTQETRNNTGVQFTQLTCGTNGLVLTPTQSS